MFLSFLPLKLVVTKKTKVKNNVNNICFSTEIYLTSFTKALIDGCYSVLYTCMLKAVASNLVLNINITKNL